jgi:DNA-binding NtrC family response regulator
MGGRIVARILIIDDEKDMLALLRRIIDEDSSHELSTESDPAAAMESFARQPFNLVITDLKMPRMDGMRVMETVRKIQPDTPVIIMTAFATIETAVEATREGAFDYITKPFKRERILVTIDNALKWAAVLTENRTLRRALDASAGFSDLIAGTPLMIDIFQRIRQVAPTTGTVLITGASGTGKELVAQAVHRHSLRHEKKMVTVNCTAIPEEIIESELFGHVKGAFTGAWQDKKGLVEEAHEGTLFLDEIGELSPRMQTRLLRLLQDGEYKPVGGVTTKNADIRFIAATNRDLNQEIRAGRFREDLYYRLNVIYFDLPPLAARSADIPLLSFHFLEKYARRNGKQVKDIAPDAIDVLKKYAYAGNVRELKNIIERAVIFCRDDTLTIKDLCLDEGPLSGWTTARQPGFGLKAEFSRLPFKDAREAMLKHFHRQYIESLLRDTNGNVSQAAEKAGIQRQYLHRLIKEAGVAAEAYKKCR